MRVLAADDDDLVARVLERQLKSWGYEATIAQSGLEAWRILKQEGAPSVVILDWDMPGLSGLEVCRLFRSTPHGAESYVLMLTGRGEKEDLVQALEAGADDFLAKPFHARELQLRLAKGIRDSSRGKSQPAPVSRDRPPSGSILGGKYRLEKKIAEGGMGSVWLGVHLSLGINVAIKFMAKDLAEMPDYASFEREARAAAQLRNPHAVRIYDHGIAHDGLPYLVMEYLAGESLSAWVERVGPLSSGALASLVAQIAAALTEAHERGLVHRDVKPDNILMLEDPDEPDGFAAKLIDFGLAKSWQARLTTDPFSGARSVAGSVLAGTPLYMSPESLSSNAPSSPLLDLWGLSVTAFFAATGGVLPFEAEELSELYKRITVDPHPKASAVEPGVPAGFDAWFERACACEPDARFQSARDLARALAVACEAHGSSPLPRPSTGVARGPRSFAPTEPGSDVGLTDVRTRTR
jgi:serine/threonine protein kinase